MPTFCSNVTLRHADLRDLPGTNEPTLKGIALPPGVRLWKSGGAKDDLAAAATFDDYPGVATVPDRDPDRSLPLTEKLPTAYADSFHGLRKRRAKNLRRSAF